jgi:hypothetical protein
MCSPMWISLKKRWIRTQKAHVLVGRVAKPDPHYFGKPDPDPHLSEKLDPAPQTYVEAQNEDMEEVDAHN